MQLPVSPGTRPQPWLGALVQLVAVNVLHRTFIVNQHDHFRIAEAQIHFVLQLHTLTVLVTTMFRAVHTG